MEKEIILKLKLDTDDSVSNVEKVEKAIIDVDLAVKHANEDVKVLKKQIKDYTDVVIAAGAESPVGKEAIKQVNELKNQLKGAEEAVKAYASHSKKLDLVVQGFSAIGHAAHLAIGAQALFGEENEHVVESIHKMIAIQSVLNGVQELHHSITQKNILTIKAQEVATKAMGVAQAAYTSIVGTSTGAMKVFKIALAATGIGAILLLIGLLITNFKEISNWVTHLGERFTWLKPIVDDIKNTFETYRKTLQSIGVIEDEAIKKKQEFIEKLDEQLEKIGSGYDFEISKAKAAGKNTFELEQQKREAVIETLKVSAQAILELAILNGSVTEEQQEQLIKIKKLATQTFKDIVVARITEEKRGADEVEKINKTASDNAKKLKEEKIANDKKALEEELLRLEGQFAVSNELYLSKQNQEIQILNEGYDKKFQLAEGNAQLEKDLLLKQQADIDEINSAWADKKLEDERNRAIALSELKLELKELNAGELSDTASPEEIAAYYIAKGEIEDEQFELEQERLAGELAAKSITEEEARLKNDILEKKHVDNTNNLKKSQADYEKALNKQKLSNAIDTASMMLSSISAIAGEGSAIAKAAAVGQATMDTYKSAVAAYAAGSSVGGPAGLILGPLAAGLAVAAGVINVKKILSTKVPSGGGSVSAPSISAPSTATISIPQGQQGVDAVGTNTNDLLNPTTSQTNKVTVLSSDIKREADENELSASTSQL